MPVVYRQDGFRFLIWTNDHRPPHVHVGHGGGRVVIDLESLEVRENKRMSVPDVARATNIVAANRERLMTEWRKIHG